MEEAVQEVMEDRGEVVILATDEVVDVQELERRLVELEARLEQVMAGGVAKPTTTGRKTASTFAAEGKLAQDVAASAMDDALGSLSLEQRIAVKMEMMRRGLMV